MGPPGPGLRAATPLVRVPTANIICAAAETGVLASPELWAVGTTALLCTVFAAFEKGVSFENGTRNNLPEAADRSDPATRDRHSMDLLKDAPLDMGLGMKREAPHHY